MPPLVRTAHSILKDVDEVISLTDLSDHGAEAGRGDVEEKYVTERAYDKPKFVEYLVHDVAFALNDEQRVLANTVETENIESIHNHSAAGRVTRPSLAD